MPTSRVPALTAAALLAALPVAGLTACSDNRTTSASTSPAPPTSSSADATTGPTQTAADPAMTGQRLATSDKKIAMGAPEGWTATPTTRCQPEAKITRCLGATQSRTSESVALWVLPQPKKGPARDTSARWDQYVQRVNEKLAEKKGTAKRGPDLTYGGETVYTYVQSTPSGSRTLTIGVAQVLHGNAKYRVVVGSAEHDEDTVLAQLRATVASLQFS